VKYEFSYFSKEHDYWLGIDPGTKRQILGIPFRTRWSTTSKPTG